MSLNVLEAGANPSVNHDEEKALVSKVAWRLMPLIMVCYLFAFFDRINISFAKFQLQADLSLSDTAYGLGAGLFVVGYVIFEVPSNMMLYKVGARRWIARIMVSWGLATAALVFAVGGLLAPEGDRTGRVAVSPPSVPGSFSGVSAARLRQ